MANVLEYTLSLQDQISAKLKAIGVNSATALDKFAALEKQSRKTSQLMNDMGRSAGSLRQKLENLREERDWIPEENIRDIRRYNTEIGNLERQIRRLETTTSGNKLKTWAKDAFSALPGADLIKNPLVVAGAAMGAATKMALGFDEAMAKINTTAQLDAAGLAGLKDKLMAIGMAAGADLSAVPEGFEKILSQVGDVDASLAILKSSLDGAKAGFTDAGVVSDALAQTLSIVGTKNASAAEVLDTLFAAKRVGAGEFKDFAAYMPQLIAAGDAMGVKYKEVAGIFAFMTAKGQNAERAATLMGNAFSALGKKDIQDNLGKEGVKVFDKSGAMRDVADIATDLQKRMAGLSDQGKSNFLERMGLVDKEAKSALMILTSDTAKLNEAMAATANAAGETDKAMKMSANPMQKLAELWGKVQFIAINLGSAVMTVLSPALLVLGSILDGIIALPGMLADGLNWVQNALHEGSPWVWGFTLALGALATALAITWMWTNRSIAAAKIKAAWDGIVALATGGWTAASTALNASLLANPLTWIIALIIGLIALIAYVAYAYDGWGKAWGHLVNYLKYSWLAFKENFNLVWLQVQDAFMAGIRLIEEGWYRIKSLWDEDGANAGLARLQDEQNAAAEGIAKSKGKVEEYAKLAEESGGKIIGKDGIHSNGKTLGDLVSATKNKIGIGGAGIPGSPLQAAPQGPGGGKGDKGGGGLADKSANAIATGGTKNTTINMQFGSLVHTFNVTANNVRESAAQIRDIILDEVTRALEGGTALAGQ